MLHPRISSGTGFQEFWSLTSEGEAGVFVSYTLELRVQKESEVDALSLGRKCEEPRRDADVELWLVEAKT